MCISSMQARHFLRNILVLYVKCQRGECLSRSNVGCLNFHQNLSGVSKECTFVVHNSMAAHFENFWLFGITELTDTIRDNLACYGFASSKCYTFRRKWIQRQETRHNHNIPVACPLDIGIIMAKRTLKRSFGHGLFGINVVWCMTSHELRTSAISPANKWALDGLLCLRILVIVLLSKNWKQSSYSAWNVNKFCTLVRQPW